MGFKSINLRISDGTDGRNSSNGRHYENRNWNYTTVARDSQMQTFFYGFRVNLYFLIARRRRAGGIVRYRNGIDDCSLLRKFVDTGQSPLEFHLFRTESEGTELI